MFYRSIQKCLAEWLNKPNRKPLVIRGARQVGKTTVVKEFSRQFDHLLYFNLEKREDREIFEQDFSFGDLLKALFFVRDVHLQESSLLICIDEIQNVPRALACLRYFYEEVPHIPVIASGSLLDAVIDHYKGSFPVGRIEFLYMHPVTFREYLKASGNEQHIAAFNAIPIPAYAHQMLLSQFHTYATIGGMPEIVHAFITTSDKSILGSIYEGLTASYIDDAAKYCSGRTMFQVLRHVLETSPMEAGKRITFQGFGNSAYRSREVGEALRILERAMIIQLLYPVTTHEFPLLPNKRKSPRLQFLDAGLMTYFSGIQKSLLTVSDLNAVYRGRITEHIVGQELSAADPKRKTSPLFWVRKQRGAKAELDFVVPYQNLLVPIEVKSGKTGTLKSLHQYISMSRCPIAVRLCTHMPAVHQAKTPDGIPFTLLDLPYYLSGKLEAYLLWAFG